MADPTGGLTLLQSYQPYGDVMDSVGDVTSNYGFANEWTDATGLQHLRARYIDTGIGRFISRDTWAGDYNRPLSFNKWMYVTGNPVNFTDPSGNVAYNRMAAANYAIKWAKSVNPLYGEMKGNDCTNFVSQAMKAGGFPEDDTWFFDKKGWRGQGCARDIFDWGNPVCGKAWSLTDELYNYFVQRGFFPRVHKVGGNEPIGPNVSGRVVPWRGEYINFPSWFRPGDVVFYRQLHSEHVAEHGVRYNHAAIIVGWGPPTTGGRAVPSEKGLVPHIVDHESSYSQFGKRAINDTKSEVNQITIVHIPDNIPENKSKNMLENILSCDPWLYNLLR